MKKRMTILLLLVAMLTSCSGGTTVDTTPSEPPEIETETETETVITDDVPELDFGGASFRSIGQTDTSSDIYAEEETGDAMNDAIYIRNRGVEERLNVVIEPMEEINYAEISPKIKNV